MDCSRYNLELNYDMNTCIIFLMGIIRGGKNVEI